jgi:hypothetical protein
MEDPNNILIIFGLIAAFLICLKAWTTFVFILKLRKETKRPPYPLGDLTPEEIEQLRQSKKEIAQRVKELWEKENGSKNIHNTH